VAAGQGRGAMNPRAYRGAMNPRAYRGANPRAYRGANPRAHRGASPRRTLRTLAAFASLCIAAAPAFPQAAAAAAAARPGREISLPPTAVKDTFFAYVLGIITTGTEIDVDNAQMREILTEFKSALNLPFDLVQGVAQHRDDTSGVCTITLDFLRDVSIPIPFSLLFYHPGSIDASQDLRFTVNRSPYVDPVAPAVSSSAFDLVLVGGSVMVDIDDWLETFFPLYLEDTWIHHIVFFQWQRDWMGMLEGTGRTTGRTMRAYFDFTRNRIMFPVPVALDKAGRVFVPDAPAASK
jgi:hypothetical protein